MVYVVEQTARGETEYNIWARLLKDRILYLGTRINDEVANLISAQLLYLESDDADKDITMYVNSPGGSVVAGLAILDVMAYVKCDVQTVCVGQASSMGAVLLASGTKGKRNILPNSRVMIHQPHGGAGGTSRDIEIQAAEIVKMRGTLNQILADASGKPLAVVEKDTDRDHFMTAEEAVAYGVVDKVIAPKKSI
jgi:ATP-dependent Clp protease, protease subunit